MKRLFGILVLLPFLAVSAFADGQTSTAQPADVNVTVTVIDHRPKGTSPTVLPKDDVVVRQNGKVRPVLSWEPATSVGRGLDVAVLVDDSLDAGLSLQWKDVASFLRELPRDSRSAVVYGTNSGATIAQPFTTNREMAIKALRIPVGSINEGSSIFLSLVDLMNRWPNDGRPRVVLLVSDGVDLFYGVRDSEPGLNQNLQKAIDTAQKDGVVVDSIFGSGASHFSHNLFLINNGQSCLARLSLETGGSSYTSGLQTPVTFAPFLHQIHQSIANMHVLTFRATLSEKAGYARLQFTAEPAGVELLGPSRVYLPAAH